MQKVRDPDPCFHREKRERKKVTKEKKERERERREEKRRRGRGAGALATGADGERRCLSTFSEMRKHDDVHCADDRGRAEDGIMSDGHCDVDFSDYSDDADPVEFFTVKTVKRAHVAHVLRMPRADRERRVVSTPELQVRGQDGHRLRLRAMRRDEGRI